MTTPEQAAAAFMSSPVAPQTYGPNRPSWLLWMPLPPDFSAPPFLLMELSWRSVPRAQAPHRLPHPVRALPGLELLVGPPATTVRGFEIPPLRVVFHSEAAKGQDLRVPAATPAAEVVPGVVPGDRIKPTAEPAPGVELRDLSMGFQKDLLRGVLRQIPVGEYTQEEVVET